MINFSCKTALALIEPLVADVLKDIVTSKSVGNELTSIKLEVIENIMAFTANTHFSWDDKLAKLIFKHMLKGNVVDKLTASLLSLMVRWIENSETKWDDRLVLPAITQLQIAIVGE